MALIGAFGDSNAAKPAKPQSGPTGGSSAAMCGYSEVPLPDGPATSNAEIKTTADSGAGSAGDVQQGTSLGSYKEQSKKGIISPENGA